MSRVLPRQPLAIATQDCVLILARPRPPGLRNWAYSGWPPDRGEEPVRCMWAVVQRSPARGLTPEAGVVSVLTSRGTGQTLQEALGPPVTSTREGRGV